MSNSHPLPYRQSSCCSWKCFVNGCWLFNTIGVLVRFLFLFGLSRRYRKRSLQLSHQSCAHEWFPHPVDRPDHNMVWWIPWNFACRISSLLSARPNISSPLLAFMQQMLSDLSCHAQFCDSEGLSRIQVCTPWASKDWHSHESRLRKSLVVLSSFGCYAEWRRGFASQASVSVVT